MKGIHFLTPQELDQSFGSVFGRICMRYRNHFAKGATFLVGGGLPPTQVLYSEPGAIDRASRLLRAAHAPIVIEGGVKKYKVLIEEAQQRQEGLERLWRGGYEPNAFVAACARFKLCRPKSPLPGTSWQDIVKHFPTYIEKLRPLYRDMLNALDIKNPDRILRIPRRKR